MSRIKSLIPDNFDITDYREPAVYIGEVEEEIDSALREWELKKFSTPELWRELESRGLEITVPRPEGF